MEALEAMNKTNKSFYKWNGLGGLSQLMYSLQVQPPPTPTVLK